ncbi:hypothetical protein L7F22_014219 [Adiantum nelumboides]|nr:hypothetical protein [Adiantum nelumboides]
MPQANFGMAGITNQQPFVASPGQNGSGQGTQMNPNSVPMFQSPPYYNLTPLEKPTPYKEGGKGVTFTTFTGFDDRKKALSFFQQLNKAYVEGKFTEASKVRKAATFLTRNVGQWWTTLLLQGQAPSTWIYFKQIFALAWLFDDFEADVMTEWHQLNAASCKNLDDYNRKMDGYKEEGSSSQDRQSNPTVHEVGEGSSQAEEGFPHAAFSITGTTNPGTLFGGMQSMVPNPMYANIGLHPGFQGTQGQFGVSQGNLGMAGFSIPPVNMAPRHEHVTGEGVQMAPTAKSRFKVESTALSYSEQADFRWAGDRLGRTEWAGLLEAGAGVSLRRVVVCIGPDGGGREGEWGGWVRAGGCRVSVGGRGGWGLEKKSLIGSRPWIVSHSPLHKLDWMQMYSISAAVALKEQDIEDGKEATDEDLFIWHKGTEEYTIARGKHKLFAEQQKVLRLRFQQFIAEERDLETLT